MKAQLVNVNLQLAVEAPNLPAADAFQAWVNAAAQASQVDLPGKTGSALVTIRIVDDHESSQLNESYRDIHKATNVLAFPVDEAMPVAAEPDSETELGDLAICYGVVQREAGEQAKPLLAHMAHMTVHGTLHLLGYDHINTTDADVMETLETRVMQTLGFPDPYLH